MTQPLFDRPMFEAALNFLALPVDYKRVFTTNGRLVTDPANSAPIWVQVNPSPASFQLKKAGINDIKTLQNITLDFEYPPNPQAVHRLATDLAEYLVKNNLAEPGLPVEDSGAGCHIVIPIVPLDIAGAGGAALVNKAVSEIVTHYIRPEFTRLAQKHNLTNLVKLEAFNIDRVLSVPGTWRPFGLKKSDNEAVDYLRGGYLRHWLPPFDGHSYPTRNESQTFTELVKAKCIFLEAESSAPPDPTISRKPTNPADWLYQQAQKRKSDDRSAEFHSLITACYLRFDRQTVLDQAKLIDELTGGKYRNRVMNEAERSIRKAEKLPKSDWFSERAYDYLAIEREASQKISEPIKPNKLNIHHLTDSGNARRLVEREGQNLRFVKEWGWLVWDGRCWEREGKEDPLKTTQAAKRTVATIYKEAGEIEDESRRIQCAKWAAQSESTTKIKLMIENAKSESELMARPDQFDRDPWRLNVLNGTVDLKTGRLEPHNRKNLITKVAAVEFDLEAKCPTWEQFIDQITNFDRALSDYWRRVIGYSLTGDTSEHCFFLCYGTGRNGKSTLFKTIAELLGDYAKTSDFNTFLERNGDGPRNDIATLAGARFVSAAEPDTGKRLAESVIKQLTGGDAISARFLRQEFFEFIPAFKLFLAANHKPTIRGNEEGIWRRVRQIPFEVTIPENQIDKRLTEKLKVELPGILNWALRGCVEWQEIGLNEPEIVRQATAAYREESDLLRDFMAENCLVGANHSVPVATLYKSYADWCAVGSERPIGKKTFSSCLAERGILTQAGGHNIRTFYGIGLVTT